MRADGNQVPMTETCEELRAMLSDLIWLNSLIATEIIQITENTSAILRDGDIPESCLAEHRELRKQCIAIAQRAGDAAVLSQHVLKHQ